jgi:serine palmitoyltransferase
LEAKIAKFLNVEEAVLYSYGFSTVASSIPAYAKQGDVIFADESVHFAIQKGLNASRSTIRYFKHNDPEDLRRLLEKQRQEEQRNAKKAKVTRKFLVVEGLYVKTGEICKLPEMLKLKNEYKVRIFVDESYSFGVLGPNGKGVWEHFNEDPLEIDNICGSLENSIAAYGGFSAGTSFIVDHQRLSGLGYCFSASLPPLQAACALHAIEKLEKANGLVRELRDHCIFMHNLLINIRLCHVQGDIASPIKHLRFSIESQSREEENDRLESIVDYCYHSGFALTLARYLDKEEVQLPRPSIRLTVNALLTKSEITSFVETLSSAFDKFA